MTLWEKKATKCQRFTNVHKCPLWPQQQQQQQQLRMCLKCTLRSWWDSQWIKCLPPKLDDLWSVPSAHVKCLTWWCLLLTSGQGGLETDPWAHWPTRLACFRSSRFTERTYLKQQGRWRLKNDSRAWPQIFTQSSPMCACTHTHTHTHAQQICTYAHIPTCTQMSK